MIGRGAWLRLWYVWAPATLIVVANVVWLAGMRGAVLGRGSLLAGQVDEAQAAVSKLQSQADQVERIKKSVTALEENLSALQHLEMAPMHERLVEFLTDVVKRTEMAGLRPDRVSYAVQREEKSGLVYFTANYRVKGSYEQIRQCAFLLESSPQFILLEGLTLRGDDSASSLDVTVQLGVGTYFSDLDEGLMKQLGINEVASGT
ncbi:MAG: type 4a pilus biogenesis protein PilO [Thermoanaerobaculaceae bacterium]|jgi:Tfp pilus assembly protein PilO